MAHDEIVLRKKDYNDLMRCVVHLGLLIEDNDNPDLNEYSKELMFEKAKTAYSKINSSL